MGKLLGWIWWALAGLAGLMMFAAQISFDDAKSNLASWLPQWLVEQYPSLALPSLDRTVFSAGLTLALGLIGYAVVMYRRSVPVPSPVPADRTEVEPMADERKSIFDQSVNVSGANRGTISPTYNNTINQAPPPEVRWAERQVDKMGDRYRTRHNFEVVTPYPIKGVFVEVHGRDVRDLQVVPFTSGMHSFGHSGSRETFAFTTVLNAKGRYTLDYTSTDPRVEIKYSFQD